MTNMPTPIHGINNENREQLMKHKKDGLVNIIKRYQKASRFDMKPEPPLNEYDTMVVEKNKIWYDLDKQFRGTRDALSTMNKKYEELIIDNDDLREEIHDKTITHLKIANENKSDISKLQDKYLYLQDKMTVLQYEVNKYKKMYKKVNKIINPVD